LPLMSSSPHPITMTQCCWRKGTSSEFASLGCSQVVRYTMHYSISSALCELYYKPPLHIVALSYSHPGRAIHTPRQSPFPRSGHRRPPARGHPNREYK
jgi:hypothetical protein